MTSRTACRSVMRLEIGDLNSVCAVTLLHLPHPSPPATPPRSSPHDSRRRSNAIGSSGEGGMGDLVFPIVEPSRGLPQPSAESGETARPAHMLAARRRSILSPLPPSHPARYHPWCQYRSNISDRRNSSGWLQEGCSAVVLHFRHYSP